MHTLAVQVAVVPQLAVPARVATSDLVDRVDFARTGHVQSKHHGSLLAFFFGLQQAKFAPLTRFGTGFDFHFQLAITAVVVEIVAVKGKHPGAIVADSVANHGLVAVVLGARTVVDRFGGAVAAISAVAVESFAVEEQAPGAIVAPGITNVRTLFQSVLVAFTVGANHF